MEWYGYLAVAFVLTLARLFWLALRAAVRMDALDLNERDNPLNERRG